MGCRMVDQFFSAQPQTEFCKDFKQTMEMIGKVAFKQFLGVYAEVTGWDSQGKSCRLVMKENPLADFVVLPQKYSNSLWYTNVVCGIIRGALDMINIPVKAYYIKDVLRGDDSNEIRVELLEG
jgi:trafficking protein particle complex subunit 3